MVQPIRPRFATRAPPQPQRSTVQDPPPPNLRRRVLNNTPEAAMTTAQAWILIVEVGIIALAYLVSLFRGRAA